MSLLQVSKLFNLYLGRRLALSKGIATVGASLLLTACMPKLDFEHSELRGTWQGNNDDSSWCMEIGEQGALNYKAILPKVGEFGLIPGEVLKIDSIGNYTLETGGRFTIVASFKGAVNRMPFLLAKVSKNEMIYYDGQKDDRAKFVSKRVDSCARFLDDPETPSSP